MRRVGTVVSGHGRESVVHCCGGARDEERKVLDRTETWSVFKRWALAAT